MPGHYSGEIIKFCHMLYIKYNFITGKNLCLHKEIIECTPVLQPNIEEFNYPMLENCAGGNTEVFVNGRELHQKDLDLLASRGLPITRHKSYLIDISGRVVDENTGEELDGLGKLAPT